MVNWHPLGTIWHPLEGPGGNEFLWFFADKIPSDETSGMRHKLAPGSNWLRRYRLSHHRLSHNHCRPRTLLLDWYLVSHQVAWKRNRASYTKMYWYKKTHTHTHIYIYIHINIQKRTYIHIYRHRFLTVAPLKGGIYWYRSRDVSTCVGLQSAQTGSNDTFTRRACWITVVLLSCVRWKQNCVRLAVLYGGWSTQMGGVKRHKSNKQHSLNNIKQVILDSIGHLP